MKNILIVFGIVLLAWFGLSFFEQPITDNSEETLNNNGQVGLVDEGIKNNYQKIRGRWTSVDDEKSVLDFSDKYKIDFYNGVAVIEGPFLFYNDYPITRDTLENENGKYLFAVSGDSQFVYEIVKLDKHNLEMIYLDRGNILKYSR